MFSFIMLLLAFIGFIFLYIFQLGIFNMKYLLLLILTCMLTACGTTPYGVVGTGYKLDEAAIRVCNIDRSLILEDGSYWTQCFSNSDPFSARLEAGFESDNWRFGISHDSQWRTGAPFNNKPEYSKTELFIDFVYRGNKIK